MKQYDWGKVDDVKDFEILPTGGYIAQILRVTDHSDREYIDVEYDIVEGPFKDYFTNFNAQMGFWSGTFRKSYKKKALPYFKGMLTAIEQSNQGFVANRFSGNERELERKFVGLTIGEEVYWNKKGEEKKRSYVDRIMSIDKIRKGEFIMPKQRVDEYNKPSDVDAPVTLDDPDFSLIEDDGSVPF